MEPSWVHFWIFLILYIHFKQILLPKPPRANHSWAKLVLGFDDGSIISAQGIRVNFEGMRGQVCSGGITNPLISDQVSIPRKILTLDLKKGKLVGSKEDYKSTEGSRNLTSSKSEPNTSVQPPWRRRPSVRIKGSLKLVDNQVNQFSNCDNKSITFKGYI